MSRSYSKSRYDHAVKEKWYCYKKVRRYEYVDATEEEMLNMAKKNASKSVPGRHSAPRWYVQEYINRPYRRACKALLDKIVAGEDADAIAFPLPLKTAWYNWY